jgi:hypothetical protein
MITRFESLPGTNAAADTCNTKISPHPAVVAIFCPTLHLACGGNGGDAIRVLAHAHASCTFALVLKPMRCAQCSAQQGQSSHNIIIHYVILPHVILVRRTSVMIADTCSLSHQPVVDKAAQMIGENRLNTVRPINKQSFHVDIFSATRMMTSINFSNFQYVFNAHCAVSSIKRDLLQSR